MVDIACPVVIADLAGLDRVVAHVNEDFHIGGKVEVVRVELPTLLLYHLNRKDFLY